MKLPAKPFVFVHWHDAHGSHGDTTASYSEDDLPHESKLMVTAGWLVKDDDKGITLFGEWCCDDDDETPWRSRTFIPRGMVVSVSPAPSPRRRRPGTTSSAPTPS